MYVKDKNICEVLGISDDAPHRDKYKAYLDFVGFDNVIKYVPFSEEQITKALKDGDDALNTLSIKKWDAATGIEIIRNNKTYASKAIIRGYGVIDALANVGITSASQSECVSLLKEAARIRYERTV